MILTFSLVFYQKQTNTLSLVNLASKCVFKLFELLCHYSAGPVLGPIVLRALAARRGPVGGLARAGGAGFVGAGLAGWMLGRGGSVCEDQKTDVRKRISLLYNTNGVVYVCAWALEILELEPKWLEPKLQTCNHTYTCNPHTILSRKRTPTCTHIC